VLTENKGVKQGLGLNIHHDKSLRHLAQGIVFKNHQQQK
jgi:hypothetical protein